MSDAWPRRKILPLHSTSDWLEEPELEYGKTLDQRKLPCPKRTAELSPLKYDSEEDDNLLNCARSDINSSINDDEEDDDQCSSKHSSSEDKENICLKNDKRHSAVPRADESIIKQLKKMSLEGTIQESKQSPPLVGGSLSCVQPQYRQIVPSKSAYLYPFAKKKPDEKKIISIFKNIHIQEEQPSPISSALLPKLNIKPDEVFLNNSEEPQKLPPATVSMTIPAAKTAELSSAVIEDPSRKQSTDEGLETPIRPHPHNFVTPSVESTAVCWRLPSARVPHPSRTRTKTKSEILNEFQSKKILFTTPKTGNRRPAVIPSRKNESLDLSSDDSVDKPTALMTTSVENAQLSIENIFDSIDSAEEMPDIRKVLVINGNHFMINKKIGSGGSSAVYLVEAKHSRKECAIKVVDLHGDPASVEGYINETKMLAKLQGNSCVIRLFDYAHIPNEKTLYMVMERGESDLHHVLQSYKSIIPCYTLITYFHQMLLCVKYIHQNGIIHSDLKPANFLIVNGRLKLIDFGIASSIATDATSIIKFSQAGTFNYISPEALIDTSSGNSPSRNQPKIKISTKSDVWSLGCILYLLLYRRTPFAHIKNVGSKMLAITNPKTLIEYPVLQSCYPPMLLEMLQKCLIYDVKSRASVQELLAFPINLIIPLTE